MIEAAALAKTKGRVSGPSGAPVELGMPATLDSMPTSLKACSRGSPLFVHLFDEIKQNDDVAHNNSDEAYE